MRKFKYKYKTKISLFAKVVKWVAVQNVTSHLFDHPVQTWLFKDFFGLMKKLNACLKLRNYTITI